MVTLQSIKKVTGEKNIAVAGVSRKKGKFGNTLFRELAKRNYRVYPVNPNITEFEGMKCFAGISQLPDEVKALVINTKPESTAGLIRDARARGITNIWVQQGAENKEVLELADDPSMNIITGKCILMFAEPVGSMHRFHRWLTKVFGKYPR